MAVRRSLPEDTGFAASARRLDEMRRENPGRWQETILHPYLDEGLARALAEQARGGRPDLAWFDELVHGGPAALSGPRLLTSACDGAVLRLRLADRGPHRSAHGHRPADPQTGQEVDHWQRLLDGAWRVLVRRHPWHAEAVAACLTTLVPLRPAPGGTSVSSAARRAYGAVALSPPGDPVLLALTLVHEFLHIQLGARSTWSRCTARCHRPATTRPGAPTPARWTHSSRAPTPTWACATSGTPSAPPHRPIPGQNGSTPPGTGTPAAPSTPSSAAANSSRWDAASPRRCAGALTSPGERRGNQEHLPPV